mmetsp:Transcript_17132/g.39129  ORF Transcript_17132/g.39129 Transcript_17132/m.39129 type:complete len:82 (-) Transcript_17132:92-337(-)
MEGGLQGQNTNNKGVIGNQRFGNDKALPVSRGYIHTSGIVARNSALSNRIPSIDSRIRGSIIAPFYIYNVEGLLAGGKLLF